MKFSLLEQDLSNANNIFDFISIVFYYLSEENITSLNGEYKKILSTKALEPEFKELGELFYNLFFMNILMKNIFSISKTNGLLCSITTK